MSVPFLPAANIHAALGSSDALEAVRTAFVEHARGEWMMPSKVYVQAPEGDFRAMPAAGAGYAVLKWVTSFPDNPKRGLPTVAGVVLLSDATTGRLLAILDAGALTSLRTGAAAVVGSGVNGRAVARTFVERGRPVLLWDTRQKQAVALAEELGQAASVAAERDEALAADIVVTVTPGGEVVFEQGSLRDGQHVSLMGADGPGKAEMDVEELLRARIVCDEWDQASHSGDIARAALEGLLGRDDVAELGRVLLGEEDGRRNDDEITVFDSTGLAVQDLAVAISVYERWLANRDSADFVGVTEIEL